MFLATRFRIWSVQEEFLSVGLWRQPISIHANKSAYQWGHKACSIRSHVSLARGMLVFHAFFSLYKIQSHGRTAVLEALEWSTCGAFAGNKMENPICNFRSSLWVTGQCRSEGHRSSRCGLAPRMARASPPESEQRECVSGRQPACPWVHPFLAY